MYGGLEIRALVDTGYMVNVVYMGAYEKMRLKRGSGRGGLQETQGYREYSGSNYRQVQGMH